MDCVHYLVRCAEITARLIVHHVLDSNTDANTEDPLFPVRPHHPSFTNNTESATHADLTHRGYALRERIWRPTPRCNEHVL